MGAKKQDDTSDFFSDLLPAENDSTCSLPTGHRYALYACVAVNEPVVSLYTYGVSKALAPQLKAGSLVEARFGGHKTKGCVVALEVSPSAGINPAAIRPIGRILSPDYALPRDLIDLGCWLSDYYMAPVGETLGCVSFIGFNDVREKSLTSLRLAPDWQERAAKLDTSARAQEQSESSSDNAESPPPGKPKRPRQLTARQRAVIDVFIASGARHLSATQIKQGTGAGAAVINKLRALGLLETARVERFRDDEYGAPASPDTPIPLNPDQQNALNRIADAMRAGRHSAFLLHGVTSSGKTEVYLQAIASALAAGGQAVVLVPEITLTPQMVARFRSRFGDAAGVYHSKMSLGQKYDLWRRIRGGSCRILIGARSAVFAPFNDLRIIVIDEEQETSYKQDSSPRYDARRVAEERARRANTVLVLGSATPSIDSYHAAKTGRYEMLSLPARIDHRPLPEVVIIDMARKARENHDPGMFSMALREAIGGRLERGEQSLLFLNRRGFFNILVCLACNTVARCRHCDIGLTHHQKPRNMLVCHLCGMEYPLPGQCPDCGSPDLALKGIGTQRVEDAIRQDFPEARVMRIDFDTTRSRTALLAAWRRIEGGEADILVGTQMIAKGLHLEGVTLVGVPLADVSLYQPDFRAAERAFSLLTQVAGRAGRGERPGLVIIQSYVPHHYAIQFARNHDYEGFYEKEIVIRRILRFPPHYDLISLLLSGQEPGLTANLAKEFARILRNAAYLHRDNVTVLGAAPAPIARIKDTYRWRLLMRGKSRDLMKSILKQAMKNFNETPGKSKIHLNIDVDPQNLM